MSTDWIAKMFADRDENEKHKKEEREQELLRQRKIEAHASTIWSEISDVLLESIAVFNQPSPIRLIRNASANPYTLNLQAEGQQYGMIISFDPLAATISWMCPPCGQTQGTLNVKIDGEGNYAIHDPRTLAGVPLRRRGPHDRAGLDEVILGEFMRAVIKPSRG